MRIEFKVDGVPVPQGSKKAGMLKHGRRMKAVLHPDPPKLKLWRAAISAAARRAKPTGMTPLDEPVTVTAQFVFQTPKRLSAAQRVERNGHLVKWTTPDLDKLQRGVGDALTDAGVLKDDSRIIAWPADPAKVYGPSPGVIVVVETLAP